MKHKLSLAGVLLAATLILSAGLSGCKPGEHDHVYGEWNPGDGVHWRECEICKTREEEEHTYGNSWITDQTSHWRECEVCHKKFAESKHIYVDVTGGSCTLYAAENAFLPMLHLSAPEEESRELYVKEVWAYFQEETPGALRVAYSSGQGGTFNGNVEISAQQRGWQKAVFPNAGRRLLINSFIRLQAITMNLKIGEIVFLANDEKGTGETVLLSAELVNVPATQLSVYKPLLDAQYFPGEKRECYSCRFPEPKTQE